MNDEMVTLERLVLGLDMYFGFSNERGLQVLESSVFTEDVIGDVIEAHLGQYPVKIGE